MTRFQYSKADVLDNRLDARDQPISVGRMFEVQRDAINDPQQGTAIFNLDQTTYQIFETGIWENVP